MSANPKTRYTLEEYFELDSQSEERLEYWNGEIFDMSGVEPAHDAVEGNVHHALRNRLRGRGCRIFLANVRIRVPAAPPYRYADLSVVCGEPQYETVGGIDTLTNPMLLVEVLSDSTEAYDRGVKFTYYRSIATFAEYLLIDPRRPQVTHFVRQADGAWLHREYVDIDESASILSIGAHLSLREVYEGVTFHEAGSRPRLPSPRF